MRKYAADQERNIRVKRLVDEWTRSALIDAEQRERAAADLRVDLRRTNRFLRLTFFGFGLLINAAALGLAGVMLDVNEPGAGILCLISAAGFALLAEVLIGRFRLYRFGIEEACAVSAVALAAVGSGLIANSFLGGTSVDRQLFVALLPGSAAAFAVYRRYGYVYAAVGAMACGGFAPFQLPLTDTAQRLSVAAVLAVCFIAARMKHVTYGDEFPGDEYGTIQAYAWLGLYAVLNLHLFPASSMRPSASTFYWFTYAIIWVLPAAGLWLSIRHTDRPLLDASLVMAIVTLLTNKPYLGAVRKPWDPILLGLLLIGAANAVRRWLARGADGSRHGFTATRLLNADKETRSVIGIASAAVRYDIPTHARTASRPSDPLEGGGGRSGGGGADSGF